MRELVQQVYSAYIPLAPESINIAILRGTFVAAQLLLCSLYKPTSPAFRASAKAYSRVGKIQ